MRCDQALRVLQAVAAGREVDPELRGEAVAAGWVADGGQGADGEAATPEQLRELMRDLAQARAEGATPDHISLLEAAVRAQRAALLDVARARVTGAWRLTWRGAELRDELEPRVARVTALQVEEFARALQRLRVALDELAARAALIHKAVQPGHLAIDEIELRALAVTLATGIGTPEELAKGFTAALASLEKLWVQVPVPEQPLAAALLTLGAGTRPLSEALAQAPRVSALALLAAQLTRQPPPDVGDPQTAVVVAVLGQAPAGWGDLRALYREPGVAAVLALSTRADLDVTFSGLVRELSRLHPGRVEVIAALLCLLDDTPAGLLDDLRLAADAATHAGLAVSGHEALAQGARLLVALALGGGASLSPSPATRAAWSALNAAVPATVFGASAAVLAGAETALVGASRTVWRSHPAHRSGAFHG